jgi:copper(I)-binding protein
VQGTLLGTLIVFAGVWALPGSTARAADPAALLRIEDAWARRAPMTGHGSGHGVSRGTGAAYVTIQNPSAEPDSLIAASSDAADSVELHETIRDGEVMRMRQVPRFEIPAGGRLQMQPGGKHIMLINLRRDLKPGERVSLTLTFGQGGEMRLEIPVR